MCLKKKQTRLVVRRTRILRPLEAQLSQLGVEGRLKLLQIRGRRTVTSLLGDQSQPSGLVEIPFGDIAVAKSDLAADYRTWARDLVHVN